MSEGKRGRPSKWNDTELKREYLEGIRDRLWLSPLEYYKARLSQQGMRRVRFMAIVERGQWDGAARVEKGQQVLAEKTEELAVARGKLSEGLEEIARLQMEVVGRVKNALSTKQAPQDLKRLSETLAKANETISLALEKPTSIVGGGSPVVSVVFQDEEAPYSARRVAGTDSIAVDVPHTDSPRQVSGGERGKANPQDRPVPEMAPVESPPIAVPGGGVVPLPIQDTGETGCVAEDDEFIERTTDTIDTGENQ